MIRVYSTEVRKMLTCSVLLKGWIHKIKSFGKFGFVMLRDKKGIVQLVIEDEELLNNLQIEMSVEVTGTVVKNVKALNDVEIHVDHLKVLGKTYYELMPFSINGQDIQTSIENQLNHRHISLRQPKVRDIFKIQNQICESFREFFSSQDFSEIHTPKILASGTEGGSELFTVNYFGNRAFLAQSPQFYKQMMVGSGFESVYEIGHAYRAELHNTYKHLNEYVSMDIETAFIDDEKDLMALEEAFLKKLFNDINENHHKILKKYTIDPLGIKAIPTITLKEAQKIVLKNFNKRSPTYTLDTKGEELLANYIKAKYDSDFVFITKYPAKKRPMYTMPDPENSELTNSFDLIYKGLEITTGGQRIHDYQMLIQNMEQFGIDPSAFDFYTESFKYGMPPHGGFAIGLERLTMKILNLDNIREASLLPRDMNRLTP